MLQNLLDKVGTVFKKKYKDTDTKFQLARFELPPTGLILDNPALEKVFDLRYIPFGRPYLFYAKPGQGKTSLLFEFFKIFQRAGGAAIWIETERAADLNYARKQGVQVDGEAFSLQRPDTLEQGLELVRFYIEQYAESYPEGDGPPLMIGFDSIAGTQTEYEDEHDEINATKMGDHAKILAGFYRKICPILETENIFLVMINQLRESMDARPAYMPPKETMLGGEAIKFSSTGRWRVAQQSENIIDDEFGKKRKIGSYHNIYVMRNKLGREGKAQIVPFDLYTDGGIDWYSPMIRDAAEAYSDVIDKVGNGRYQWKIPNTSYIIKRRNAEGVIVEETGIIDVAYKYPINELVPIIASSHDAKEVFRKREGIPALPPKEVMQVVKNENTATRKNRKKKVVEETTQTMVIANPSVETTIPTTVI